MSNITLKSADLSTYGLITRKVRGVHDLAGQERARAWVKGRDIPADVILRRSLVIMEFECVMGGTSHADVIDKLNILKPLVSPELDWSEFLITDQPGKRTFARSLGFPINIDTLPYQTLVIDGFPWSLERYPYWEDASLQTVTDPASIDNTGDLPTFPVYTCTVTDTLGSGLWFEVNTKRFTYTGPLVATDVLVVTTDLPDVTLNGTKAIDYTDDDTEYPELVIGANAVSKSSALYTFKADYRCRFE